MDPSRYARLEDEQRYLVAGIPTDVRGPRVIEDRYLHGTRLRLRVVADETGTVRKLGHKVRVDADAPSPVWHTTCYLDDAEYAALAALPADTLRKRRWHTLGGAADEFLDDLFGLVLVEGPRGFPPPAHGIEVSSDERFCGAALAALEGPAARALVAGAAERAQRAAP